jgi:transcriptional regulator with XRE-family HTH domain
MPAEKEMTPAEGFTKAILSFLANGNAIRAAREQVGASQAELAVAVGISQAYMSLIETGERTLTDSLTLQICAELSRLDQLSRGREVPLYLQQYRSLELFARLENGRIVMTRKEQETL